MCPSTLLLETCPQLDGECEPTLDKTVLDSMLINHSTIHLPQKRVRGSKGKFVLDYIYKKL
jgi:hypothetical protein